MVNNPEMGSATSSPKQQQQPDKSMDVVEEAPAPQQEDVIPNVDPSVLEEGLISDAVSKDFMKLIKTRSEYIPLRLNEYERSLLTVIEGGLDVSEYTDNVDVSSNNYFARAAYDKDERVIEELQLLIETILGLIVSHDNKSQGLKIISNGRGMRDNAPLVRACMEVGRRYKIMNPDKMRSVYGKLLYVVMDSVNPRIRKQTRISLKDPIKTVQWFMQTKQQGPEFLMDPQLEAASMEITNGTPAEVAQKTARKASAIQYLIDKYAVDGASGVQSHEDVLRKPEANATPEEETAQTGSNLEPLTSDEIRTVVASITDNASFLRANRGPVDRMIYYLKAYFSPNVVPSESLQIRSGRGGSKLSHSHQTQYYFVLQSLTLWKEIMGDFFRLWYLAEQDLLCERNGYRLCNTGQGLQRCQSAPRVSRAMQEILAKVRSVVGQWVGLSVVHLGDRDVPNALTFIDKYTQVPRILGPIVHTLDKIGTLVRGDANIRKYVESVFGGGQEGEGTEALVKRVQKVILLDFFRHGFDGSGDDGGSCIDGRLTSTWNWCSKLEKKPYYPIFLLTGFAGFDGDFRA